MTDRVAYELRQDQKLAGCFAVKIRYADFSTFTRQQAIDYTSRDDEMIAVAKDLFKKLHKPGQPVRLLGVRLTDLTGNAVQANLFDDVKRKGDLYKAVDEVKNKFGKLALKKARTIK